MPEIGKITEVEVAVEWKIERLFSLVQDFHAFYHSPRFSFAGVLWRLYLGVQSLKKGNARGHITLRLGSCSEVSYYCPLQFEYALSVKTCDGRKYGEKRATAFLGRVGLSKPILIWLNNQRRSELALDGSLTVICHLQCINTTKESEGESLLQKNKVLRDLKGLFLNKEHCDVVLRVKGQEFPALKAILTARSPVFAATFQSNMKEKATGAIEIEDCDLSSFPDFLCYLYCGEVENLSSDNVFSLFTVADKYDVQDLRAECLEFMTKNLSVNTLYDTFKLALHHFEFELVDETINFFNKNMHNIISTAEWKQFSTDHPTESNELLSACI